MATIQEEKQAAYKAIIEQAKIFLTPLSKRFHSTKGLFVMNKLIANESFGDFERLMMDLGKVADQRLLESANPMTRSFYIWVKSAYDAINNANSIEEIRYAQRTHLVGMGAVHEGKYGNASADAVKQHARKEVAREIQQEQMQEQVAAFSDKLASATSVLNEDKRDPSQRFLDEVQALVDKKPENTTQSGILMMRSVLRLSHETLAPQDKIKTLIGLANDNNGKIADENIYNEVIVAYKKYEAQLQNPLKDLLFENARKFGEALNVNIPQAFQNNASNQNGLKELQSILIVGAKKDHSPGVMGNTLYVHAEKYVKQVSDVNLKKFYNDIIEMHGKIEKVQTPADQNALKQELAERFNVDLAKPQATSESKDKSNLYKKKYTELVRDLMGRAHLSDNDDFKRNAGRMYWESIASTSTGLKEMKKVVDGEGKYKNLSDESRAEILFEIAKNRSAIAKPGLFNQPRIKELTELYNWMIAGYVAINSKNEVKVSVLLSDENATIKDIRSNISKNYDNVGEQLDKDAINFLGPRKL